VLSQFVKTSYSRLKIYNLVERTISTCQTCRIRSKNMNYRFRGRGSSKAVLLERFIKFTPLDASLVCKSPFHLKCSGSFFDSENNVDTVKNFNVGQERDIQKREEKLTRRRETRESLESSILGLEELSIEGFQSKESQESVESTQISMPSLPDDYKKALNYADGQGESSNSGKVFLTLEELEALKSRYESSESREVSVASYPLHLKLLGRSQHRVDSYSIQTQQKSTSHIYISDAQTAEEALAMFGQSQESAKTEVPRQDSESLNVPKGSFSIWSPVLTEPSPLPEVLSSQLSVYCPAHILEPPDPGLKAVFFTPIMMNKIFLETERQANTELNCKLMDQLAYVGIVTEYGQIKVRDIWSHEVRLSSSFGDVVCEGTVEGDITAETRGDGDFSARVILGNSLRVITETGDIAIWDDLFSELAELFTISGHVHVRRVYGALKVVIREHGMLNVNVLDGSVDAVVRDGDIVAHLEKINEDSYLEVGSGNIHIHIPKNFPHRISLLASKNTISPHILNCGEFSLTPDGKESFVSGIDSFPGELEQPSLIVRCHSGEITLQGPRPDKQIDDALGVR